MSPEGGTAATCGLGAICQRGRGGGSLPLGDGRDFLPLFLSRRTQQIKPPRTANHQLILAQIPKGPELLQGRFLHRLLVAQAAAPHSPSSRAPSGTPDAGPELDSIRPLPSQATGWEGPREGRAAAERKRTGQTRELHEESGRHKTAATGTGDCSGCERRAWASPQHDGELPTRCQDRAGKAQRQGAPLEAQRSPPS